MASEVREAREARDEVVAGIRHLAQGRPWRWLAGKIEVYAQAEAERQSLAVLETAIGSIVAQVGMGESPSAACAHTLEHWRARIKAGGFREAE
jgi:hypothetical protein